MVQKKYQRYFLTNECKGSFIYSQLKISLKYPDLHPQCYISKRSKNIHMVLKRSPLSVTNNQDIVSDIYEHFNSNHWKFNARFVYPTLINTTTRNRIR